MTVGMKIPVVLLKTRSQPHDTYEEYFSTTSALAGPTVSFQPIFVPVLEHKQDEETLGSLGGLLKDGKLKERYGGMIFTSQRAVEGWADTVLKVERESQGVRTGEEGDFAALDDRRMDGDSTMKITNVATAIDTRTEQPFITDILSSTPFPLYTVGPATSRALNTLVTDCASNPDSLFTRLNPEILGAHTGNGANLAKYMLNHYNTLHDHKYFTFYEAPRLPFIPLLGMGSENYSRKRLEESDPRLQKKPLLFLVGEQRRDIIPKSLMNPALGDNKIEVEEKEVYSTIVKQDFQDSFTTLLSQHITSEQNLKVVIIIVFSPQGSDTMLRALEYIDSENNLTEKGRSERWTTATSPSSTSSSDLENQESQETATETRYIIATIGPTTRDHLINTFGFEPDICAEKPSPEGLGKGIEDFFRRKKVSYR